VLRDLRITRTERGANVWLVVPNDAGVLHGSAEHDGVPWQTRVEQW
jgi:hypothetical protein